MKYKSLGLAVLLAAFAGSALAQTPVSGTIKCPKSDATYSVEVGDRDGHELILEKGSCTSSVPLELAGLKSTTISGADSVEVTGARFQVRGYQVTTMENWDKTYARYQGTGSVKNGVITGEGTWSYTGGTGKLKGIKGKGSYKSSGAPGGEGEAQVEGEYSVPDPSATAKKK